LKNGEVGKIVGGPYSVPRSGNFLALRGRKFQFGGISGRALGLDANNVKDTHDGGVAVKFIVNDKEICSSNAVYGGTDSTLKVDGKDWATIARMTECPGPFHLNKGDKVTVVATYDTVKYPM
jgi:hypothetical protein